MSSNIVPKEHNLYSKKLSRNLNPFSCRSCGNSVLPKYYEKHCSIHHNVDVKTTCVWCRCYTWQRGEKYKHASHLRACSDNFFKLIRRPTLLNQRLTLLNMQHPYPQKTLFDFQDLPTSEYDSLWPLPIDPSRLTVQDDNLNLAASYVQKYMELQNSHDWLHIMVKAVAFDRFVNALNDDQGTSRILLFSCWCNGGPYTEARHRQHRHMIVVSPTDHFENHVWPKVTVPLKDRPCHRFPCKGMERIASPLHLVNTLGYVSHRKSKCKFTTRQTSKTTPFQMHHFYLYRTLPKDFVLPLVLLWDSGLKESLYQEKFQNVSVRLVAESPITLVGSQWQQKLKDFYSHERGLVIPVSKGFTPTPKVTPHFLYLLGGKNLYFKFCPEHESLDVETWMRKQAEGGNCFYDAVEEEMWTPRPRDQAILSAFMPVVLRNRQLESENRKLKRQCENTTARYKKKCQKLKAVNQMKQKKIDTLHDKMHERNEEENARLKEENARLQQRIKELEKQST